MNFLLHRHLAQEQLASPAAGVGAMLPDLWRMADRRVMARADSRADDEVSRGVRHHLAADDWFHESPVFVEGERATADALRSAPFRAARMTLFAHVTWELCLDAALVARLGVGPVTSSLRDSLEATRELAGGAAEEHHFGRVARSREERQRFDARMERIFTELPRGPWVERYASAHGVALIVSSLRERIGMEPLDDDDIAHTARALGSVSPVAARLLDVLLATAPAFSVTPRG